MMRALYACDICGCFFTTRRDMVDAEAKFQVVAHKVDNDDVCADCFRPIRTLMIEQCSQHGALGAIKAKILAGSER